MAEQEWTYSVPYKEWELNKRKVFKDLAEKTKERFPELCHSIDTRRMYFCLRLVDMRVEKGILHLTYSGDWSVLPDSKVENDGD